MKWLRGDSLPERPTVDGTVLFHGLLTDVTERRLAEAKLRFTQFATDHAADAILWAGPDRRIMYVNVRATELLGYSREELLNLSMPDIAPLQSRIDILNDLTRLKQGEVVQYATTFRRKSERSFPSKCRCATWSMMGKGMCVPSCETCQSESVPKVLFRRS